MKTQSLLYFVRAAYYLNQLDVIGYKLYQIQMQQDF